MFTKFHKSLEVLMNSRNVREVLLNLYQDQSENRRIVLQNRKSVWTFIEKSTGIMTKVCSLFYFGEVPGAFFMVSRLDSKGAEVRKSCKNIWNRLTRLSRDSSIQKQSLFFMEKRCSPARLFFNPSIETLLFLSFFLDSGKFREITSKSSILQEEQTFVQIEFVLNVWISSNSAGDGG